MPETVPRERRVLVRVSDRGEPAVERQPWNPASEVHGWLLSRRAGLGRIAVNLAWLPSGKEAWVFHRHHREEEWLYVLEGSGTAEVDDREVPVGPNDFLGYPPGTAHHLRNTGPGDLLFLAGGEVIPDVEVVDFPRLGRRLVRVGTHLSVYPASAEMPFEPSELPAELVGASPRDGLPRVVVKASERGEPRAFTHPQNPRSRVLLSALSRPAGLKRVAVLLAKVLAGHESFVEHVHQRDEEWAYVISGQGVATVGGVEEPVGPGDFMGFPAGGPSHHVRALAGEDLLMLEGGDAWSRTTLDIVDFPGLGLRRTFVGTKSAMTFPLSSALEKKP